MKSPGLHHVTAICRDGRQNVLFYTKTLGLRLIKKTVNFDDPTTWHLYYADVTGVKGTILTFFVLPQAMQGRPGSRTVTRTWFSSQDITHWKAVLTEKRVPFMIEDNNLLFQDPDGMPLGIMRTQNAKKELAIHAVTLSSDRPEESRSVLDILGVHNASLQSGQEVFLEESDAKPGTVASGMVHHVAFRAPDYEDQEKWRQALKKQYPTEVVERNYFKSVYFREPSGILFEIATNGPGFLIDEDEEHLGKTLQLPPWLEPHREAITKALPPLGDDL